MNLKARKTQRIQELLFNALERFGKINRPFLHCTGTTLDLVRSIDSCLQCTGTNLDLARSIDPFLQCTGTTLDSDQKCKGSASRLNCSC